MRLRLNKREPTVCSCTYVDLQSWQSLVVVAISALQSQGCHRFCICECARSAVDRTLVWPLVLGHNFLGHLQLPQLLQLLQLQHFSSVNYFLRAKWSRKYLAASHLPAAKCSEQMAASSVMTMWHKVSQHCCRCDATQESCYSRHEGSQQCNERLVVTNIHAFTWQHLLLA